MAWIVKKTFLEIEDDNCGAAEAARPLRRCHSAPALVSVAALARWNGPSGDDGPSVRGPSVPGQCSGQLTCSHPQGGKRVPGHQKNAAANHDDKVWADEVIEDEECTEAVAGKTSRKLRRPCRGKRAQYLTLRDEIEQRIWRKCPDMDLDKVNVPRFIANYPALHQKLISELKRTQTAAQKARSETAVPLCQWRLPTTSATPERAVETPAPWPALARPLCKVAPRAVVLPAPRAPCVLSLSQSLAEPAPTPRAAAFAESPPASAGQVGQPWQPVGFSMVAVWARQGGDVRP